MGTTSRSLPLYHETPQPRGDLTRAPVLGRFLRWKHARTAVQIPLLLLAAIIVADGLFGPATSPQNAAGVAPWVQWRGLVVLGLLVFGNLFCMACPFMLPRRLAKRFLPADRVWPSWLRAKWLALALLVLFFWAYEAFDLWDSPWLTAWLVLTYFAAAFVVDGFFKGAAFCKYACPIGSFNFVNSLASPGEVRVRDSAVCESCQTKDCIAGRRETDPRTGREREVQSGCELWLFQPRKAGNLDCTFCLDCIQACPYDNVGIMARMPGRELVRDRWRSGIGRLTERPDMVALSTAVVFAAFLNAAGMIEPMASVRSAIGGALGTGSEAVIWSAVLVLGLGVAPIFLLTGAGALSRWLAGPEVKARRVVFRMAFGLVPVGFGMWIAHYAFHLLASGLNLVPVLHRGAVDVGVATGPPDWSLGPLVPPDWLLPLELIALEAGLLGSLVLLYYISRETYRTVRTALRAFAPWAVLAFGLAVAGAWIMAQPMAMRGMMMPGMEESPGMEQMSGTETMRGVHYRPAAVPAGGSPEVRAPIPSIARDRMDGRASGGAGDG
jgi:polyferredoxin